MKVLRKESEESKARIKEALAAAEGFEHEAMTLSEQVSHLISDLKEGRRDLRETLERTAMLQDALETTATRLERVERASATERAALVQSALASLHHLRCHFAAQQVHPSTSSELGPCIALPFSRLTSTHLASTRRASPCLDSQQLTSHRLTSH